MAAPETANVDLLKRMDDSKITSFHLKVMFISGMGFFTDAYDLFVIGVVMALLKPEWRPSRLEESLVTSTALLASALGAVLFGRVADMLGRKRIYGLECLVLAAGAVASAFSPSMAWLIAFRFILGVGIGGDYPVSATIMSEYAGKCTRGMLVSLVFAMQAAGLVCGPLLAAALLASHLSHDTVWRILLAAGAVPALAVVHMRRGIRETPRFILATGDHEEFRRAAGSVFDRTSRDEGNESERKAASGEHKSFWKGFQLLVGDRRWRRYLVGASLAWFLMDFAYYGNTVSSPMVLAAITPDQSLLKRTLLQLAVFAASAVPGYFVAALTMDRLGRKFIQSLGFGVMAASFAALALVPGIETMLLPFLLVYGASYFFTEFGPNATTFIYPSEIFPVHGRTTGHGIAAATGKLGGFVGVFLFPFLMHWHGLLSAELTAAGVSVLGLLVTLALLPETKGKSLEELTRPESEPSLPGATVEPAA